MRVVRVFAKKVTNPPLNPQAILDINLAIVFPVQGPLLVVVLRDHVLPLVSLVLVEQSTKTSIMINFIWLGLIPLQPLTQGQVLFSVLIVIYVELFSH